MERLKEIEERMTAIKTEIDVDGADLDALETEVDGLKVERKAIEDKVEKRKALVESVTKSGSVIQTFDEVRSTNLTREDTKDKALASPEYRNAYLKKLVGRELNDVEQRSIAATNVDGVMPTETSNQIFTKMREVAPMLNEVTLFHVPGNLKFGTEGTNNAAAVHTENAELTAQEDTIDTVSLGGYEIAKLVRISKTVSAMAIPEFESWLTDILAENIAVVVENYIINGTGSSQPKGIDYYRTWTDTTTAVDWAAAAPTIVELREQISYLAGGYFRKAKWLCSHGTFWDEVKTNVLDSTDKYIESVGEKYYMMGKEVIFSDYVRSGDLFLGDYKKIVANFAQDIQIASSAESGFIYNAVDFRADCLFDCDTSIAAAYVKGAADETAGA